MSVLGVMRRWAISEILGTGYMDFASPTGVNGLAKVRDKDLHLLAVGSAKPGKGQFREFMRQAKMEFKAIYVWAVMNPDLEPILMRYGFQPTVRLDPDADEFVDGYVWKSERRDTDEQGQDQG